MPGLYIVEVFTLLCSGKEIGMLRKKGVEVSEEVEVPQFAFLGDTTGSVFEEVPELFSFPVVIVECTYLLDDHLEAADPSGHIHWNTIAKVASENPQVTFVLIHWSMRYSEEDIANFFDGGKPANVVPWI